MGYVTVQLLTPQIRFIIGTESLGKLQIGRSIQSPSQQTNHQPLIGLRWVPCQRQSFIKINAAVRIRHINNRFKNRRF